jgi:hypothetical protein
MRGVAKSDLAILGISRGPNYARFAAAVLNFLAGGQPQLRGDSSQMRNERRSCRRLRQQAMGKDMQ